MARSTNKETVPLTATDFTQHSAVRQIIDELHAKYPHGLKMSDLVDANGNQYVNLVQEGGGVLGIALVGFTYVLESMGIRFWRLAGTSAGAINTLLLASVKNKQDAKSEEILNCLAGQDINNFIDGYWILKPLSALMIRKPSAIRQIALILAGLLGLWLALLIFHVFYPIRFLTWFIIVVGLFYACLTGYMVYLLRRFKNNRFGLNPGDVFSKWITDILDSHGVDTLAKLKEKAYLQPDDLLQLKQERLESEQANSDMQQLSGSDVVLVACDITTQMKVEFPKNARLYWENDSVHPAEFVRASMSIPMFFETHPSGVIDDKNTDTRAEWLKIHYNGKLPPRSFFVDGGIVSNFPINVFHNNSVSIPRLPSIGARLGGGGSYYKNVLKDLPSYLKAIFFTVSLHHDKQFLSQHNFYEKYVAHINVQGFNWLNFGISKEEKISLFLRGVEAARKFIQDFDWEEYKAERQKL